MSDNWKEELNIMPAAERSRDLHFTQAFRGKKKDRTILKHGSAAWSAGNI